MRGSAVRTWSAVDIHVGPFFIPEIRVYHRPYGESIRYTFSFLARYIVPTDHGGMRAWWCVFAEVKAAVPGTVRWTHRVISNRLLTIHLENLIDNNFC